MKKALVAHHLVKRYGTLRALDGVDLTIEQGSIFGFLGPNGAGKSTFIRIMLGLIQPSDGTAELFGCSVARSRARASVGYLPEQLRVYPFLTVEEFIDLHAALAGIDSSSRKRVVRRSISRCGLDAHRKKRMVALSKGLLQRAGIAQAILGGPKLLFLDEPVSGLDPIGIQELRVLLQELQSQGTTVFLNSHLLSEVERTCDRIAILYRGRIIRSGSRQDLSEQEKYLEIIAEGLDESMLREIRLLCCRDIEHDDRRLKLFPKHERDAAAIHACIIERGGRLNSLAWKGESLEELFYRLIQHENLDNS